jgi:hypothetical protein
MTNDPVVVAGFLVFGCVFLSAAPVQVFGSDTVGIGLMEKGSIRSVAGESQPTPLPVHAATDPTQPTQPNPQPEQPTQPTQPGQPPKPKKPPTKGVDDNGFDDARVHSGMGFAQDSASSAATDQQILIVSRNKQDFPHARPIYCTPSASLRHPLVPPPPLFL